MLPFRFSDLAAASVHVFTASGAVCGLMAALATFDGAWERMFVWLGLALVIDAIDGTFARLFEVEQLLPSMGASERLHHRVVDACPRRRPGIGAVWSDDELSPTTLLEGHRHGDGKRVRVVKDRAHRLGPSGDDAKLTVPQSVRAYGIRTKGKIDRQPDEVDRSGT